MEFANEMFKEPEGFRPPTPPQTSHRYVRDCGQVIEFDLIGQHSLWAHVAWNAGKFVAGYLDSNPDVVRDKSVLELGCGAALPSMVAALNGAKVVVATDYPDLPIIDQLKQNISHNNLSIHSTGLLWGSDVRSVLGFNGGEKFNVVILCDLVFNHTQHFNMLQTCMDALDESNGIVLCAFSHHRPWLKEKDREFLSTAASAPFNLSVELICIEKMNVMFEQDPGDYEERRNVYFYCLSRQTRCIPK